MKVFRFMPLIIMSQISFANSMRDIFITKVMNECEISKEQAIKLATKGRTGNIVKLRLCPQNPVKFSPTCKVKCSNASGTVIGN